MGESPVGNIWLAHVYRIAYEKFGSEIENPMKSLLYMARAGHQGNDWATATARKWLDELTAEQSKDLWGYMARIGYPVEHLIVPPGSNEKPSGSEQ